MFDLEDILKVLWWLAFLYMIVALIFGLWPFSIIPF